MFWQIRVMADQHGDGGVRTPFTIRLDLRVWEMTACKFFSASVLRAGKFWECSYTRMCVLRMFKCVLQ